jgi:hypothetical protein
MKIQKLFARAMRTAVGFSTAKEKAMTLQAAQ